MLGLAAISASGFARGVHPDILAGNSASLFFMLGICFLCFAYFESATSFSFFIFEKKNVLEAHCSSSSIEAKVLKNFLPAWFQLQLWSHSSVISVSIFRNVTAIMVVFVCNFRRNFLQYQGMRGNHDCNCNLKP